MGHTRLALTFSRLASERHHEFPCRQPPLFRTTLSPPRRQSRPYGPAAAPAGGAGAPPAAAAASGGRFVMYICECAATSSETIESRAVLSETASPRRHLASPGIASAVQTSSLVRDNRSSNRASNRARRWRHHLGRSGPGRGRAGGTGWRRGCTCGAGPRSRDRCSYCLG